MQLTSQIACEHQHEIIQLEKLLNTFNREWECAEHICANWKKSAKTTLPLQQHYWRFSSGRAHTSPRTWREYMEKKRDMKGERNEQRRKKEASDKNCRSNKSQHETPWCFGKYLVLKKTPFWSFKQKYIFFSLLHNILDFLYIYFSCFMYIFSLLLLLLHVRHFSSIFSSVCEISPVLSEIKHFYAFFSSFMLHTTARSAYKYRFIPADKSSHSHSSSPSQSRLCHDDWKEKNIRI